MAFNVLIVDDSPVMRSFVRRVLRLSGFDIGESVEASNGVEALDALRNNWIDVILTDINMPQMDGYELLKRLEQDEVFSSIPVIVVTTDGTDHRMEQMFACGAKGYVRKPFLPETLRDQLNEVLGARDAAA